MVVDRFDQIMGAAGNKLKLLVTAMCAGSDRFVWGESVHMVVGQRMDPQP